MRQERDMEADVTAASTATVAYQLWRERGCPQGSDQEDWFRAEAMLKISYCETLTQSEMPDEFASEPWQEGHWEVWEREWVSARWVSDLPRSGVGVSNPASSSRKAA
jgi:hypothetical protein